MQSAANNTDQEEVETWEELQNAGIPIDYNRFKARWDSDPILKQLVTRFNDQGIVLNTNNKQEPKGQGQDNGEDDITKMAMAATDREFA